MSSENNSVQSSASTSSESKPKNAHKQLRTLGTVLFGLVVAQAIVWLLETVYQVFSDNQVVWLGHLAHSIVALAGLYVYTGFLNHVNGGNKKPDESSDDESSE